ncbi:hypothetical protein ABID19_006736 [Mesorhizobium robiniae]|uniref:Uncharacterized protein n=1 Tax=Mesorhizobium robiniae TaxID=559315 RepID=A0ABV2GZF5_9HYPH|nr:hypothetical protein [Mesorhizobium sp. ZC-5]MCV3242122.1 hypothetical protein [Mesorhizobium sp. ZC-5]
MISRNIRPCSVPLASVGKGSDAFVDYDERRNLHFDPQLAFIDRLTANKVA